MEKRNWKRKTLLFLISQCITLFGSTLVQMAIVWYITLKTSSGAWVAAVSICSYLPQFLISFVGGVWADRYNRKKLIILSDGMIAAVTFLMVLAIPAISSDSLLIGALLVMSVIRSIGAGIQVPAVNAVIPQLVPENALMRYNGINATMQSIVQFVSPAVAGLILTSATLQRALTVDVVTAIVGITLLCFVAIPKQKVQKNEISVFADMKTGIRYSFSDKTIGALLMIYGMFILLCVPAGFMSGVLVSRVYGETYWYLTAVELTGFAGMALGGALMGIRGETHSRVKTLMAGFFIFGTTAICMGISHNFLFYLIMMFLYGIALTLIQTVMTTMLQEKAECSMQGRVFGLMGAMYSGFLPVGMAAFGPMADVIPLQWIMIGSGIGLIFIAIFIKFHFKSAQ
ncbi:MAG: MFS transporter [Eubacteriales bacterium]|nr:MFS transporter [Eubacteriales bacterium]